MKETIEPTYNYAGKHEPDTDVEINQAQFGGLSFARYSFRDTDSVYQLSVKLRMKTQWSDGLLLWIGEWGDF